LGALSFECRALEKLTVAQRVKKFLTFCETVKFSIISVRLLNNEPFETTIIEKQSNILDISILLK
jgi:hypothetical protein